MKKCKKQQQFSQIYLVLMVAILAGCQDSRANELDLIKPSDISIDDLTQDPDAATTSDSPEQTTDSTTVTVLDVSDISDTFNSPDPCSGDAYYEYKFLNLCMDLEQDWKMRLGGPCQNDDQCESQICFHHPNVEGEGFCTATCRNDVDCLPGWGCPIQETPPDICTCTPRPEVCDRLDNDCNGLVDDGRPTELGCGPAERCENARCVCNSPLQSDGSCACRSDADCPLICKDGQCLTAIALDVGPSQEGCAVLSDGSVWCWQAYLEQPDRYPIRVEGVSDAVDVVLSESAVCALDRYGFVWCWGSDALGELGTVV